MCKYGFVVLYFIVCGQGSHYPSLRLGGGLSVRESVCVLSMKGPFGLGTLS